MDDRFGLVYRFGLVLVGILKILGLETGIKPNRYFQNTGFRYQTKPVPPISEYKPNRYFQNTRFGFKYSILDWFVWSYLEFTSYGATI